MNKKESKIYAFSRQNLVNKFENVKEVIFNFDTLEADIELNNWDHIYICLGRRLKVWELIYCILVTVIKLQKSLVKSS